MGTAHPTYSLLPTPYSLLPTPYSLLPTPYSLAPCTTPIPQHKSNSVVSNYDSGGELESLNLCGDLPVWVEF